MFACIIRVGGGLRAYFRECMGWWWISRGDVLIHGVGMSLLAAGCCGALAMLMSSIFGWSLEVQGDPKHAGETEVTTSKWSLGWFM